MKKLPTKIEKHVWDAAEEQLKIKPFWGVVVEWLGISQISRKLKKLVRESDDPFRTIRKHLEAPAWVYYDNELTEEQRKASREKAKKSLRRHLRKQLRELIKQRPTPRFSTETLIAGLHALYELPPHLEEKEEKKLGTVEDTPKTIDRPRKKTDKGKGIYVEPEIIRWQHTTKLPKKVLEKHKDHKITEIRLNPAIEQNVDRIHEALQKGCQVWKCYCEDCQQVLGYNIQENQKQTFRYASNPPDSYFRDEDDHHAQMEWFESGGEYPYLPSYRPGVSEREQRFREKIINLGIFNIVRKYIGPRNTGILEDQYIYRYSAKNIGLRWGVSKSRVEQICRDVLTKLLEDYDFRQEPGIKKFMIYIKGERLFKKLFPNWQKR